MAEQDRRDGKRESQCVCGESFRQWVAEKGVTDASVEAVTKCQALGGRILPAGRWGGGVGRNGGAGETSRWIRKQGLISKGLLEEQPIRRGALWMESRGSSRKSSERRGRPGRGHRERASQPRTPDAPSHGFEAEHRL